MDLLKELLKRKLAIQVEEDRLDTMRKEYQVLGSRVKSLAQTVSKARRELFELIK